MSMLDISKTLMYEFWYDYVKAKYGDNVKSCYPDTDGFIMHIKTEDFYEDIVNDVKEWFDISNYKIDRPLLITDKVLGKIKGELGRKIMAELGTLRPKIYSYLMDYDSEIEKAKGIKKCLIERVLKFNDYKDCLLNNEVILKSQQRFKSEGHDVYTEEIKKIAFSSNDDKRLQTFEKTTSYP